MNYLNLSLKPAAKSVSMLSFQNIDVNLDILMNLTLQTQWIL